MRNFNSELFLLRFLVSKQHSIRNGFPVRRYVIFDSESPHFFAVKNVFRRGADSISAQSNTKSLYFLEPVFIRNVCGFSSIILLQTRQKSADVLPHGKDF